MQETGETRNAIIENDNKQIAEIIRSNKDKTDPYWIVVFAKPAKQCVDGMPTLVKHIKAYNTKPQSQVGMIVGEVCNRKGTVSWEVNMPQKPFDFDALGKLGGKSCNDVVVETTSIADAYITQ